MLSRLLLRKGRLNTVRFLSSFVNTNSLKLHPITQGKVNLSITSIDDDSLSINGMLCRQSVLLFPKSFYLWSARTVEDITLDSLALVPVIFPTLEMLLIGCGDTTIDVVPREDLMEEFRSRGIVVEFMSSHHAATTYNVMNEEERHVGAAILLSSPPPIPEEEDNPYVTEFRKTPL